MEGKQNILEAIYEDETVEDFQDVEMLDSETLEEGEFRDHHTCLEMSENGGRDAKMANQESRNKNRRRKTKKKNKKSGNLSNITDINRFVLDTCRRLKERKPYLVWNAVGCLGVSALTDLIKEVDAIQTCGGQMTVDGNRSRTGGGILWNILKTRDLKVYKEIMTKGKEFERQFRPQNMRQAPEKRKEEAPPQSTSQASLDPMIDQVSKISQLTITPPLKNEPKSSSTSGPGERISIMSRIRVPVTYDDLLLGDDVNDVNDESTTTTTWIFFRSIRTYLIESVKNTGLANILL